MKVVSESASEWVSEWLSQSTSKSIIELNWYFIESVTAERSKINEYVIITLHLQEFFAVNVKGAALKGKVPARCSLCRAVLLPLKLFLLARAMSKLSAVPDNKNLTTQKLNYTKT